MAVLERHGGLVDLLALESQLLGLGLLLMEVSVGLNDIILGELAQHLKLIQELTLAVHQHPLLIQLLSQGMDLVLTIGVFYLDCLFDCSLFLLFGLDDHFLIVNYVSEGLGLTLQLFLFDLQKVEGLHQRFHTRFSTLF